MFGVVGEHIFFCFPHMLNNFILTDLTFPARNFQTLEAAMSNFFDRNNFYYQENERRKEDARRKELSDYARRAAEQTGRAINNHTIDYYRQLLSKPMEEIAAANGDFKATFEKQQEIIADWIVSQKAFRELAYEFGEKLGLSQDEIKSHARDARKKVITNQTNHDNNANENTGMNILVELTEKTIESQKAKNGL